MSKKAAVGSSLAGTRNWDMLTLEDKHLDRIVEALKAAGHSLTAQSLAQTLSEMLTGEISTPAPVEARVKKYDHRCNYEEGEQVFVDNRYGKSLATVTKIIRQPPTAFCDKAFLEFEDSAYRSKWEGERSTPYFAIHSGRTNVQPEYVTFTPSLPTGHSHAPRFNATAILKLAKAVDRTLSEDERFAKTPHGWLLAEDASTEAPTRGHISAEPGGTVGAVPLPQGCYKAPLLEVIDRMGEATIEDIKKNIQSKLELGPADWRADHTGKIVWIHRLHAAIKHLKRVGAIDSPRREVYRRIGVMRQEKSA